MRAFHSILSLVYCIGLLGSGLPLISANAAAPETNSALQKISALKLRGGASEILAYDPARKLLVTPRCTRFRTELYFISLANPRAPQHTHTLDLNKSLPVGVDDLSSVAIDPLGRGFAAVAVIPKASYRNFGAVHLIDLDSMSLIATYPTGYHPDAVAFTPDGKFLALACEGEYHAGKPQTPGSITIINLQKVRSTKDLLNLKAEDFPIDEKLLVPGIRYPNLKPGESPVLDLEPEYLAFHQSTAYVCLQENNAIAEFDLNQRRWKKIVPLGSWPVKLDPSDRDGAWGKPKAAPETLIDCLPQPDAISTFSWRGKRYLATANEGDNAGNFRVKHLGRGSAPKLDPNTRAKWKQHFGIDPQNDAALGRLQISPIEGDTNGDGMIDKIVAFGTRSFTIWDVDSWQRVYDSGSLFEEFSTSDRGTHNVNKGRSANWDTRSDNKGPEPAALTAKIIEGRPLIAVATERQNALYLFDASNPRQPKLLAAVNEMRNGHYGPENMLLLSAKESPTGTPLCICGWEDSSSITIYQINL